MRSKNMPGRGAALVAGLIVGALASGARFAEISASTLRAHPATVAVVSAAPIGTAAPAVASAAPAATGTPAPLATMMATPAPGSSTPAPGSGTGPVTGTGSTGSGGPPTLSTVPSGADTPYPTPVLPDCVDPQIPPAILGGAVMPAARTLSLVTAKTPLTSVTLAVVANPSDRESGLMCVTALRHKAGMIFVFASSGHWEFWMKNTLIPLDMVWLDARGNVTNVAANVPRSTLNTPDDAVARRGGDGLFVIELPAGDAARDGFKTGAHIKLPPLHASQ